MTPALVTALRIPPEALQRCLGNLAPLPQATLDALQALRDESQGSEACAEMLGHDPALAARALRLANSAFYGVPGRVTHLRDAVHLLGRRTLSSLLTVALLASQVEARAGAPLSTAAFWRHALGAAFAARGIAEALHLDAELAFVTGLLHDIGRLTLVAHFPRELRAAIQLAQGTDQGITEVEEEHLGTSHVQVGAMVALHWRFPPGVAQAIALHHAPVAAAEGRASLSDVVHLADAVAHALDLNADPHERVPPLDPGAWERIALPPRVLLPVLRAAERGVAELSLALGIAPEPLAA